MEERKKLRYDGKGKGKFRLRSDFCLQLEKYHFDSCKERMRSTFDELLIAFMRGKLAGKCIISIPILCGDCRPVDLFKLFWVVRKIGGHYTVSKNNLWGFVSKQCGLGFGVIPFIKLVYFKYLNELNQWLYVFTKGASQDALSRIDKKLDILSWKLENRLRGLSWDKQEQKEKEKDSELVKYTTLDISNSGSRLSLNGEINGRVENVVDFVLGEDGKLCAGNKHFCLAVGTIDESIVYGLHGHVDRGNGDDYGASTKREIGKVLNKAIRVYKSQTDMECGKYRDEDGDGTITSAKKAIEKIICKVLNNGETVANEGHPMDINVDACMQADDVAMTSFDKTHVFVNITDEEKLCIQAGDDTITPSNDTCNVLEPRKRKRESLSFPRMLSWLTNVAKHSDTSSVGSIPECSKWSSYGVEEFWFQVLLVREALLIRRSTNTDAGENILKDQQKKPRMHPSMYEDDVLEFRSPEERRYSRRITSLTKPKSCPCCSSLAHRSQNGVRKGEEVGKNLKAAAKLVTTDLVEPCTSLDDQKSVDMSEVRQVSVGPLCQAEVPEWTGLVSESDVKWLGTTVWQPDNVERNSIVQSLCIGKGRQNTCNCPFAGSVECVRFHIAETRLKLKQGLGSLFYDWGFNRMGEEVSLSWTEEQEKIFKDMVRSCAAFPNKFWNNASRLLSSKTRQKLVSYYFNVYVIQRRSYQNRVTPKDIDSDDDEKECGMIGGSFGHNRALFFSGPTLISCTLNTQSTELK